MDKPFSSFSLPSENDTQHASFLVEMYKQMWSNINRHILVVWQSVSVLLGTLAAFSLVEKNLLPIDLACTLVILIGAWQVAHCVDANYWFNRNLAIITNIERHFLRAEDLQRVHPYFNRHRQAWPMLDHLGVQALLGSTFATLVLAYHFFTRVVPGFRAPMTNFEPLRAFPSLLLWFWTRAQIKRYRQFSEGAPGPVPLTTTVTPSNGD